MKETIDKLEDLMTGLNYCTTFGFENLGMADKNEELKKLIKNTFPDSKPEETELIEITESEFWDAIQLGFDFRGDYAAGMNLSTEQEAKIKIIQEEFKNKLKNEIKKDSKFYHYPSEEGIPGYVVMWNFSLIFNNDKNWFFVYGSASD